MYPLSKVKQVKSEAKKHNMSETIINVNYG